MGPSGSSTSSASLLFLTLDAQKGSLPTARIRAHNAKIYGIDWAQTRVHDIVTCSLDKTIKVWNVQDRSTPDFPQSEPLFQKGSQQLPEPLTMITTRYPVWRARDLPFGRGILSLPQRGETALEMWAAGNDMVPVEIFEGHTDVVKEFVWRKGGLGTLCTPSGNPLVMLIAPCRRGGVPANNMVQGSNVEILARGFRDYGGKCIVNTVYLTVLTKPHIRKRDTPSDLPKCPLSRASLLILEDRTSLSDMSQEGQNRPRLYLPQLVREAY